MERGIDGDTFSIIQNFLQDRICQIRMGQTLSQQTRQLTAGTPQESVLRPLLFILAINDIQKHVHYSVQCLLYADDVVIFA